MAQGLDYQIKRWEWWLLAALIGAGLSSNGEYLCKWRQIGSNITYDTYVSLKFTFQACYNNLINWALKKRWSLYFEALLGAWYGRYITVWWRERTDIKKNYNPASASEIPVGLKVKNLLPGGPRDLFTIINNQLLRTYVMDRAGGGAWGKKKKTEKKIFSVITY